MDQGKEHEDIHGDRAFEKQSNLYGNQKQGTYKVSATIFAEKGVHQYVLDRNRTGNSLWIPSRMASESCVIETSP